MSPDLSVILTGIRERHANLNEPTGDVAVVIGRFKRCTDDVPRLLAAVEAVLELTDSALVLQEVRFPGIPEQQPFAWDLDPSKIREAITAALLGEAGDGTR